MEEGVKQDSATDEEIEDWRTLFLDPNNTRSRIAQFKETLYLYWLIKSLLGKAMEHISVGKDVSVQGMLNYKQEFQKLRFQLHKQDNRLGRIERCIPCILELSEMPGLNSKDPMPVELASADQNYQIISLVKFCYICGLLLHFLMQEYVQVDIQSMDMKQRLIQLGQKN